MSALPFSWKEWSQLDAIAIGKHVRKKDVSATEVADQARAAMAIIDPKINALLEHFAPASTEHDANQEGIDCLLEGVPIVFKDLGSGITGQLQEQGSALYRGHRATQTDPLAANLIASGLSIVGRAASAELGMAFDTSTTYNGLRITRNPWHTEYTPGGSSGGSAALVASGAISVAHGTDGAGSIRIPAALTGLIGLKVTRGFLPPPWRFNEYANPGMVEGFLTRSVRDTAALLDAGRRHTPPGNSFTASRHSPESLLASLDVPLPPLRIALSTGCWGRRKGIPDSAQSTITQTAKALASSGHIIEEIDDSRIAEWDSFWNGFRSYWLGIRPCGWPESSEAEELTPILQGYREGAHRYGKEAIMTHQNSVNRASLGIAKLYENFDLLLCPVLGRDHAHANGPLSSCSNTDFEAFIESFLDAGRYTILANETGLPAISLPAGFDTRGLPLAFQLYAPWHHEARLLQVARFLERQAGSRHAIPEVHISRASAGEELKNL